MTCYSIEPKDLIFVKGDRFLCFAKNIRRNIRKNIRKNLSSKYSRKFLDHNKQSATETVETIQTKSYSKNSRTNWWFDW